MGSATTCSLGLSCCAFLCVVPVVSLKGFLYFWFICLDVYDKNSSKMDSMIIPVLPMSNSVAMETFYHTFISMLTRLNNASSLYTVETVWHFQVIFLNVFCFSARTLHVLKILYKVCSQEKVEEWLQNPTVQLITFPQELCLKLLVILTANTYTLPRSARNMDGFQVQ